MRLVIVLIHICLHSTAETAPDTGLFTQKYSVAFTSLLKISKGFSTVLNAMFKLPSNR